MLAKHIKPKFREIFNVPPTVVGKAFAKRFGRSRKRAKFNTSYVEIKAKRIANPDLKINDGETLERTWGPYENLQQNQS